VKTITRVLLVLGLLAAIPISAVAAKKVTLRAATWDTAEGAHWIRVVFDKFQETHPGIEIELESIAQGYSD